MTDPLAARNARSNETLIEQACMFNCDAESSCTCHAHELYRAGVARVANLHRVVDEQHARAEAAEARCRQLEQEIEGVARRSNDRLLDQDRRFGEWRTAACLKRRTWAAIQDRGRAGELPSETADDFGVPPEWIAHVQAPENTVELDALLAPLRAALAAWDQTHDCEPDRLAYLGDTLADAARALVGERKHE